MCVSSMVMDHYREKWQEWQGIQPLRPQTTTLPYIAPLTGPPETVAASPITQAEVDEFRKLLDRAREYDKRNHEPECEDAEKKAALLAVAKTLGLDISFIDEK